MTGWLFLGAAVLLGIERVAYGLIWRYPAAFKAWCAGLPIVRLRNPVAAVRELFLVCKVLQIVVFAVWVYLHGGSLRPHTGRPFALAAGILAIAVGQALNLGVFLRLGTIGVFYGRRFGYDVPWCGTFPFSRLSHPQYVGTVLSIWGLFLVLRFPHADWYLLPALETAYYTLGARFERDEAFSSGDALRVRTNPPATASVPTTQGTAPASRLTLT
jgi:phosphatidyl-N-methylethanolamine N-methyltransferase